MSSSDPHVFDPLADAYKMYRPSYPEILLQELAAQVGETSGEDGRRSLAIDVGAGTGISTRQLALSLSPTWEVVGVDLGVGMNRPGIAGGSNSRVKHE